ncbi:uncharacterized protein LOC144445406 [Glandiceps talaboti]
MFSAVYSKHAPNKQSKTKPKAIRKPWMTKGLLISVRKKHNLFAKTKRSPNNLNIRTYYKRYRNILTKVLKSAKRRHYHQKFHSASGNPNKLWSIIGEVLTKKGRKMTSPKQIKDDNPDRLLTDKERIAEKFNSFFTNIGPNLASSITSPVSFHHFLGDSHPHSFFFHPVIDNDIVKIIKRMDPCKAMGHDHIHPKVVIDASPVISGPLAYIVNCSLATGIFPDALKFAKITPIYKKGCALDVGNYRPISILPTLSKVIESVVKDQLLSFLDKFNILISTQYGFRKQYSTKLALADLVSDLSDKMDDGYTTFGIFIDLKQAFDTIDHDILLQKLSHYGIRGHTLHWFRSYLENRQQVVNINGISSSPMQVNVAYLKDPYLDLFSFSYTLMTLPPQLMPLLFVFLLTTPTSSDLWIPPPLI